MKYLKSFNENMNSLEIDAICEKYGILNYTINEDGSIDVGGNVDLLPSEKLTKLPLKFRNVGGDFNCYNNQLTSLEFCPQSVGGDFACSNNQLTSLKFCPQNVGGGFRCSGNQLTTLKFCPQSVGGDFACANNELTTLKFIPKRINGILYCYSNNIKNIDYLPYYKTLDISDNPISKILKLFNYDKDLILDFKEKEIIQNDILIMDRLVEFLEDIGKPYTRKELTNRLEKEYEIR